MTRLLIEDSSLHISQPTSGAKLVQTALPDPSIQWKSTFGVYICGPQPGMLVPHPHPRQCLETFSLSQPGGRDTTGTWWVDARNAGKHSTTHGTAPATKSCPAPNADHAELKHASSWAKQTRKSCHIAQDVYPSKIMKAWSSCPHAIQPKSTV